MPTTKLRSKIMPNLFIRLEDDGDVNVEIYFDTKIRAVMHISEFLLAARLGDEEITDEELFYEFF